MSWKQTTLGEIVNLKRGFDLPASKRIEGPYPIYSSSGQTGTHSEAAANGPCVITGRYGTIGQVFFSDKSCWPLNTSLYSTDFKGNDPRFVYYLLKTIPWQEYTTASAVPGVNRNHVHLCPVCVPDYRTQTAIASVLGALDEQIVVNTKLNGYLEELLLAQFTALSPNENWTEGRADSYYEIGIGKTPPRKEPEWFSDVKADNHVWLSIKDMGEAGTYSLDSSEYLTDAAVNAKNVRRVPAGSVLLSFKLTVGRVKIAGCNMTTNEAIACFASDDKRKLAYAYPYLRSFDYGKLGSTSSIATAVNSKTVKAMPFAMPGDLELSEFYLSTKPIYEQLLATAKESCFLAQLRDVLLPKLMSGEIDVTKVVLTKPNSHLTEYSMFTMASLSIC